MRTAVAIGGRHPGLFDSPMQSITFQAPGFDRDVSTCSFAILSRTAAG